jgi:MoxR-like ATPase
LVRVQRLIAAAAALNGRGVAQADDLWPLIFAMPSAETQTLARSVLKQQLDQARSDSMPGAAHEASQGRAARAALLEERAALLLAQTTHDDGWKLKLEGLARDIDAAFAPELLPPGLRAQREHLVAALQPPAP